jgi:hypothetical protein
MARHGTALGGSTLGVVRYVRASCKV